MNWRKYSKLSSGRISRKPILGFWEVDDEREEHLKRLECQTKENNLGRVLRPTP